MVQRALNTAYRERNRSTPFAVAMGRAPPTAMSVLTSAWQDGWNVDRLDKDCMHEMVKELVERQEALHENLLRRVTAERRRNREAACKGVLPVFHVGVYVLVTRPREVNEFVVTWTGSCGRAG